jgi:Flp pilus assembly protein TadG
MKPVQSIRRNQDGSMILEATIVTPMLFVAMFGVFEFSWYFFQQQLVEAGIRDAARYMARVPITSTATPLDTNPCNQTDVTGGTSFQTYAANIAVYGTPTTSGTPIPRVKGWAPGNVSITCGASPLGNYADGATTMTIVYVSTNFTDQSLGSFGLLHLAVPSLSAAHHERWIGDSSPKS